jgi:hypothetical protein
MNPLIALIILLVVADSPGLTFGQLTIATNIEPRRVFFGPAKSIPIIIHNSGGQGFNGEIRARILQTSSATAVGLSENPWKQIQVPAGETVLESVALDFPAVKAETKFLVQWLEGTNRVIGKTEVLLYPTNLLAELKPLAGNEPLGVFDPQNQFKPLLKNLKIDFENLENADLETFSGKLAVVGPFQSQAKMREGLANQIKSLAKKGAAVVWLQPPDAREVKLLPSFYSVLESTHAVVIVQSDMVSDLANNPQSQCNLISFCKLALHPQPPALPDLFPQP